MISQEIIALLKQGKNLLAFSGGLDSTALFFILQENNINFDLAMLRYRTRKEARQEISFGIFLSKKFNKKIFIKTSHKINSNFEQEARELRYAFFDKLALEHNYKNVLTAHQLNDKLEWFLMQMSKGAGLLELFGMEEQSVKNSYNLVRPLLKKSKNDLKTYLKSKNQAYFLDATNLDLRHKRNYFRHNFSDKLIDEFQKGISLSFEYLQADKFIINSQFNYKKINDIYIIKRQNPQIELRQIISILKTFNLLLSAKQLQEIKKEKELIISKKIAISKAKNGIFINPYIKPSKMDKRFKETCRIFGIPPKLRGYIWQNKINPENFRS